MRPATRQTQGRRRGVADYGLAGNRADRDFGLISRSEDDYTMRSRQCRRVSPKRGWISIKAQRWTSRTTIGFRRNPTTLNKYENRSLIRQWRTALYSKGCQIMSANLESRMEPVADHLRESAAVKQRTIECCTTSILAAADLIAESFRAGGKLLLCGNGGSAADCQHLAAEFTSRLSADFVRPGLPAIALTTDTSFLTAYGNDFDFDGVFARQVQALGKPGDVLLGISTSGNSTNVIQAAETARGMNIRTIALTGASGGQLKDLADVAICVPSDNTQHIQETHLAIEHIICHLVERALFGEQQTTKV
jgi:phosphoheptose isomerase